MSFWADYERESRARIAKKQALKKPACVSCGEPVLGRRRKCPTCVSHYAHEGARERSLARRCGAKACTH